MQLYLQLPVQSVPITTNVVSSNPVHGEVYSIKYYVIKFVSDLWQVGSFLRAHRFLFVFAYTISTSHVSAKFLSYRSFLNS